MLASAAVADLTTDIAVVCVAVAEAAMNAKNPTTGSAVTLNVAYVDVYSR